MESHCEGKSNSAVSVFVCCHDGCSATFTKSNKLEWHMRLHTGERPFVCPVISCRLSYTRKFHLTRHMKVHQSADKSEPIQNSFKCSKEGCSKQFSTKHGLYKHLKYSHEKRTFQCEVCPKAFVKHQHLKVHSQEHTRTLAFKCSEPGCDKSFSLPSRLKRHQRMHDGYTCDVEGCAQVFSKWTLLRKHRKVDHQPSYKCETCNRIFYSKSNRDAHAVTHASDRENFPCPREGCSRFYLQLSSLRAHILAAHEKRKFACGICDRTFFSKQAVKRHQKLHDPNKPLPKKRRPSNKCRRKGYHTKSAAAVLSGYDKEAARTASSPVSMSSTCCAGPDQQDASNIAALQTLAVMGS